MEKINLLNYRPIIRNKEKTHIKLACKVFYPLLNLYFNISSEGKNNLEKLKDKGFFLLPKHQRKLDILLEGMLLEETIQKQGYYFMKSTLPQWLKNYGGIEIIRAKDIYKKSRNLKQSEKNTFKKNLLKKAERRYKEFQTIALNLIKDKETIIFHPEGTFKQYSEIEPHPKALDRLVKIQDKLQKPIPFVSLSICYGSKYKYLPRQGIHLKISEPLIDKSLTPKKLEEYLKDMIIYKHPNKKRN